MADEVLNQLEDYRKRLLEAVAQGGSQGKAAFEASQKALTAARGAALARAAERARIVGGPEAAGFEGLADDQYSRRLSDLETSEQAFDLDTTRRYQAHDTYLAQAKTALPVVRAEAQRLAALKAAEKMGRSSAGYGDLSDSELRNMLSGEAENLTAPGGMYAGQDKSDVARALGAYKTMSGSAAPPRISGLFPRQAPTQAAGLASKYKTKGVDLPTAQKILDDPDFQSDVEWLMSGADGKMQDEVDALLRQAYLPKKPRTYEILRGEFLSRIPKK